MFCSQCGAKNADDASFCQKCGKKLETSSQDDEPTLLTPPRSSSSPYGTLSPPRTTSGSTEPNFAAAPPVGAASERSNRSRQASPTVPPGQKSRQRLWIVLSLIAVVLFLLAVSGYVYLTRSTPQKTLDTFCTALAAKDYQTAYNQLSSRAQSGASEASFANSFSHAQVTSCTFGSASESGATATNTITFFSSTGQHVLEHVTLIKDSNGTWKIDTLALATGANLSQQVICQERISLEAHHSCHP